jgi:hypothetical protein
VTATLGTELPIVFKIVERLTVGVGFKNNRTAIATVTAIGWTSPDLSVSVETRTPIAAATGFDEYFNSVYEHSARHSGNVQRN